MEQCGYLTNLTKFKSGLKIILKKVVVSICFILLCLMILTRPVLAGRGAETGGAFYSNNFLDFFIVR